MFKHLVKYSDLNHVQHQCLTSPTPSCSKHGSWRPTCSCPSSGSGLDSWAVSAELPVGCSNSSLHWGQQSWGWCPSKSRWRPSLCSPFRENLTAQRVWYRPNFQVGLEETIAVASLQRRGAESGRRRGRGSTLEGRAVPTRLRRTERGCGWAGFCPPGWVCARLWAWPVRSDLPARSSRWIPGKASGPLAPPHLMQR